MSTLHEVLASRHRLSVYHVYHKGEEHVSITPFLNPRKELGCTKKQHEKLARNYGSEPERRDSNSYFVHKPCLAFHDAPRTLRRGNFKRGPPICIMNCGTFWRNWNIQFGPDLNDIIDPRGVVKWEHRSNPNNTTLNDDRALKGYKVRTWRLWGNSGKEYHRQVNFRRKARKQEALEKTTEPEVVDMGPVKSDKTALENEKTTMNEKLPDYARAQAPVSKSTSEEPVPLPAVAEEAVRLVWDFPISMHCRQYTFEYADIKFTWEGTRDLQPNNKWARRLMPFNHLRLLARLPGRENERLFIAQYTSSFAYRKFGELWVFDSVISDILKETGNSSLWSTRNEDDEIFQLDPDNDIRETRLFDLVMATAMCMVISEWKKRMVLLMILAIASEGGDL
ncbi:hypothetical protein N7508_005909 [Penicillium antarcticum]|uniref:uncharacterized protein n=1 Tax=Penicillium antarcticum TaxID=416450 RepID=UPI002390E3A9|nr:uncharacterized protein N7508_005909 [Penicillium antarcticum]KAJ5306894.1 hypothetical protein N7508_005909 [Penicillium antarcticum]